MTIFTPARRVLYAPAEAAIQVPFIIDRHAGVLPSYATDFAHNRGESEYPELWKGLVGFWPIFLGQTGGVVKDLSGNGWNLTHNGDWVPSGILLNGSSDEITHPTFLDVIPTGLTIHIVITPVVDIVSGGALKYLLRKDNISGTDRMRIYFDNILGTITFFTEQGGQGNAVLGGVGNTTHFAGRQYTFDFVWGAGVGKQIYVDGNLLTSDATQTILMADGTETDFFVGSSGGAGYLNIIVEQTIIYGRALSASEIALLSSNPTALVQLKRRAVMVSVGVAPAVGIPILRRRREAC